MDPKINMRASASATGANPCDKFILGGLISHWTIHGLVSYIQKAERVSLQTSGLVGSEHFEFDIYFAQNKPKVPDILKVVLLEPGM